MAIEETLFIIKPDTYQLKEKIIDEIKADGRFEIISTIDLQLKPKDIINMYRDENEELSTALSQYMSSGSVQAGVIKGENAVNNFFYFCGYYANPSKCDLNSIRAKYGTKELVLYGVTPVFHNGIHRSTPESVQHDLEIYWSQMKHKEILDDIKKIIHSYPDSEGRLKHHIIPVVNYGKMLAEEFKADKSVVEIACYLHDITRMAGDIENHHINGSKLTRAYLVSIGYPDDKTDLITQCILNHRGSKNNIKTTIEEKIVASADAMAIITYPLPLFYSTFNKKGLDIKDGTKYIQGKLKRSWDKIELDFAKEIVKEDYNNLMRILNDEKY